MNRVKHGTHLTVWNETIFNNFKHGNEMAIILVSSIFNCMYIQYQKVILQVIKRDYFTHYICAYAYWKISLLALLEHQSMRSCCLCRAFQIGHNCR